MRDRKQFEKLQKENGRRDQERKESESEQNVKRKWKAYTRIKQDKKKDPF